MPYESLQRGRASLPGHYYLITTAIHGRSPVFHSLWAGRVVLNALRASDLAGYSSTVACVVMPDHLHWLMQLTGPLPFAEIVRRVKGRSAREINLTTGYIGALWQNGFHDHAVRSDESLQAIARYVIENPVRAGLVSRAGDY